jgi:cyclic pyranopterin phosphate synthase
VTDRCNLSCIYCKPAALKCNLRHEDILRYEEIEEFVRIAAGMGITKVRITGGEPLVRLGLIPFLDRLSKIEGVQQISLTTNGVLLGEYLDDLSKVQISGLNISLDSLERENFRRITGHDRLHDVLEGIHHALSRGFSPLKINTVLIRNVNEHEIISFAEQTLDLPVNVRFIEYMPFQHNDWSMDKVIRPDEILSRIAKRHRIAAIDISPPGIDSVYRIEGARGHVSIIHPVSSKFCASCNRIRLTADGKLKSCLFSVREFDLKKLIRSGGSREAIGELVQLVVSRKPPSSPVFSDHTSADRRGMFQIGG